MSEAELRKAYQRLRWAFVAVKRFRDPEAMHRYIDAALAWAKVKRGVGAEELRHIIAQVDAEVAPALGQAAA